MKGRYRGVLVLCLASCAGSATPAAPRAPAAPNEAPSARVRLVHSPADADFWVHHDASRDLVIAAGARLEVAPSGEITSVAWDLDLARRSEPLLGALAVSERLGGGFVHWSHRRVFRSRSFTGPLDPIASEATTSIRGARNGATSVLVFTESGPRELAPGAMRLRSVGEAGLLDVAALEDGRRVKLDVFGRASATTDGKRFVDLAPALGLGVRHVVVGDGELWLDTSTDRFPLRLDATVGEPAGRPVRDSSKLFQIAWRDARTTERNDLPWASGPLAAAIGAGGDVGDGTVFGVVQGTPARVDLRTGKVIAIAADWTPNGLVCLPVRAPDALLFACSSAIYAQRGGYVLRSEGGAPPVLERTFSGDGLFASDDDGRLAYLGACAFDPRPPDDSPDPTPADAVPLSPVLCVRRGPGDWVERRVELDDGATLLAWVPGANGSAAALVVAPDPLPPPASHAGRVTERAGVRIVQIEREQQGFAIPRASTSADDAGNYVDRRFHLRDDGSIDVWLSPSQEASPPFVIGGTIDPRGALTIHPAAPAMIASIGAGRHGLSLSRDGDLYETVDRGRTFRLAGPSPAPASAFSGASCSALGCALGSVVRVGWGDSETAPRVLAEPIPDLPSSRPAMRLACKPSGAPEPIEPPRDAPAGSRMAVSTGWGDAVDVIRDAGAKDPVVPPVAPPPAAPSPASKRTPAARAPKKPPPTPAVLKTHTLVVRSPFSPRGAARRLNATDGSFTLQRRSMITPLLGQRGDVDLLIAGDRTELLVSGDRISAFPWQEGRRYARHDNASAGLVIAPGRALVLGEVRRRLSIEERGLGVSAAPILIGTEVDPQRRRPLILGRRDDGAIGVLVLDGPAPETAGVAPIDRVAAAAGPIAPLAPWSSLALADDPVCRPAADPGAFRALIVIDPTAWITLDPTALPGFDIGHQGIMLVRWGRDRVCLEGLDATLVDQRARGSNARAFRLVARWEGAGDRGAALRAPDLRQDLVCRVAK